MKDRVAAIETPDPQHVRFKLKAPWPDFLTFYATRHRSGLDRAQEIRRKGRRRRVQEGAGRRRPLQIRLVHPGRRVGARGLRPVLAQDPERQAPGVQGRSPKRRRGWPRSKRGEVDIVYSIRGELAEELQRTPGLTLKPVVPQAPFWVYFADQWDAKSPWHDERVRRAASLAMDRKTINDAITLGYSKITGSIIPYTFEFFWQPPVPVYDPAKAKQLLGRGGPSRRLRCRRVLLRLLLCQCRRGGARQPPGGGHPRQAAAARAGGLFRGLLRQEATRTSSSAGSGAFGNAATRLEAFVVKGGAYVYGSYPDIDALYRQQAVELDPKKREAILRQDAADRFRAGDLCADLAARLHQWRRAAGRASRGSA